MTDFMAVPGIFPNLEPALPDPSAVAETPLMRLAYLVGGVWIGKMTSGSTETVIEERIRWAIEGSVMVSRQLTRQGGLEPIEGFGLMAWNPKVGLIQMMKLAANGVATGQETQLPVGQPETVTFLGSSVSASGTVEWRQSLTQVDDDTMKTLTEIKQGDGYQARPPTTFHRHPTTDGAGA